MDRITLFVDRVFSYYHRRRSRSEVINTLDVHPRYFGTLATAPLNVLESGVLFLAEALLKKLRKCELCSRGHEQEYFINFDGFPVHVDCGAEYNDAMSVDPTTQRLGESEGDYKIRMYPDFPELW